MDRLNLIWIIVDSVRTYRTYADDRDRLDIMDEFALESVEFLNAYTSAPSSILSGAAMFTGMPCCFISRHFDAWQFDPNFIISLQNILASKGYENVCIHNSKEDREVMKDLIYPVSAKYFPKGISHGKWWTNRQVNEILENIVEAGLRLPGFFMLWYDCRQDPNVSKTVKAALEIFKKSGLYENSVIVMCSDHGYPDPRTGFNKAILRGTRHDMIVTDDNVRIPLFIRFPGCKSMKIQDTVGTIDLMPTILDLLNIESNDPRMKYVKGYNLVDLLHGKKAAWDDRIVRIDTRLRLAKGRITALRSNVYKYVYYYDECVEELYDLRDDPKEMHDILSGDLHNKENVKLKFRQHLQELQTELNEFHAKELKIAFEKNAGRIKENRIGSIIFLNSAPLIFLRILAKCLRKRFSGVSIDLLVPKRYRIEDDSEKVFDTIFRADVFKTKISKELLRKHNLGPYDISLIICENSSLSFEDPAFHEVGKIISKKVLLVDYNMKIYSRRINLVRRPVMRYKHNQVFYKQEPLLLVRDLLYFAKVAFAHLLKRNLVYTPDMEKVKKMRDRSLLAEIKKKKKRIG